MTFEQSVSTLFNHFHRKVEILERKDDKYVLHRPKKVRIHPNDILREVGKRKYVKDVASFYVSFDKCFHYLHYWHRNRIYQFMMPDGQDFLVFVPHDLYAYIDSHVRKHTHLQSNNEAVPYVMYMFMYHRRVLSKSNRKMYRKIYYTALKKIDLSLYNEGW